MKAGTLPWLLRHELRLTWRSTVAAGRRTRMRIIVAGIVLHLLAVPIALAVGTAPLPMTPALLFACAGGLAVVWSLMVSQSLFGVAQALYMRGDLDLLLSSPFPARTLLAVRATAIMGNAVSVWACLALPFVDLLVVMGAFRWLTVYPMLLALGLAAAAMGLALAMLIFTVVGAARARMAAQVTAALVGVAAFLASQVSTFLGPAAQARFTAWLGLADRTHYDPASPLWLPARALLGDTAALVPVLATALALFVLAVLLSSGPFARHACTIAGLRSDVRLPRRHRERAARFGDDAWSTLLRKEWRLLRRDPWLLSQILTQVLYLLPLCFLYWRQTTNAHAALGGLAMMATVIAGHLAGGLVWITIASEDAPDLLLSAPIAPRLVLRAKLVAALAPVAAILLLPLIGIASQSLGAALLALIASAMAAATATLVGLWFQKPAKRRNFMLRRKGSAIVNIAELILNFLWGLAAAMAVAGSLVALVFVGAAGLVMLGLKALVPAPAPA